MSTPQGPAAPPPGSRLSKVLVPVALLVIAVGVGTLFLLGQGPAYAVGDCVARGADDSISVTDCGSDDAAYEVVGVLADQLPARAGEACLARFPQTTATYVDGDSGQRATALCLVAA